MRKEEKKASEAAGLLVSAVIFAIVWGVGFFKGEDLKVLALVGIVLLLTAAFWPGIYRRFATFLPRRGVEEKEIEAFGYLLSAVLFGLAYWLVAKRGSQGIVLPLVAGALLAVSLSLPRVLAPVYRVWMKGAHILGLAVGFVILSIVYFIGVGITAILVRGFMKDPLDRKIEPDRESYWGERMKVEYDIEPMRRQF